MILDIIIVAFVLLFMVIGIKRGIAKSLFGIICIAVAGILAYFAGKFLAEYVYNTFILNPINDSIKASFESASVSSGKVSEGIFDCIPGVLTSLLGSLGITQKGFAGSINSASHLTEKAVLAAVDDVISPVIITFISVGFIILLYIIFWLILRLAVGRKLLKLFELPIIKWVNALLGGILGLGEGILLLFLAIIVIRLAAYFSTGTVIPKEMIDSSYLFKSVYYWDYTVILSTITGK